MSGKKIGAYGPWLLGWMLVWGAWACASGPERDAVRARTTRGVAEASATPEAGAVAYHLAVLRRAGGSPAEQRKQEEAELWLLSHPDESFPRILAEARRDPSDLLALRLLGRYRKAEAVPVLAQAFELGDWAQRYAAVALGRTPGSKAEEVLLRALSSSGTERVVAALEGLEIRGDAGLCPQVKAPLSHSDSQVRWMALHAAGELGCLSDAELARWAEDDAHPRMKRLAIELRKWSEE